jgi:hypothetical protein
VWWLRRDRLFQNFLVTLSGRRCNRSAKSKDEEPEVANKGVSRMTRAVTKLELARLLVPPTRSPKQKKKTAYGVATYGGTHALLNPSVTLCGIYYSDDPKAQFHGTCKTSEKPTCPRCVYEMRLRKRNTAIVKPEPASLAGSPSLIAVPMIDEQGAVELLEAMNDTQVIAVAKASNKLTDTALAVLRERFYNNGKIDCYESCKTWGAVLEMLGIPERTARHRIARSGVSNPANKHDGSRNRTPKPKKTITLSKNSREGVAPGETTEVIDIDLNGSDVGKKLIGAIERVPKPQACPNCCQGRAEFSDGEWRCTGKADDADESVQVQSCGWRSEHDPKTWQAVDSAVRKANREADLEAQEKYKEKEEELREQSFAAGREAAYREIAASSNSGPGKDEKLHIAVTVVADHLAVTVAQSNGYGLFNSRKRDRLCRAARQYLALRGLDTNRNRAPQADIEILNESKDSGKRRKPTYTIKLTVEASRFETVRKKADEAFGTDLKEVIKVEHATSRNGQLDEAMQLVEDAKSEVESLKEELEQWKDNLPESLQNGSKGEELDEAIQALEEVAEKLDDAMNDSQNVCFPGMY